MVTKRRPGEVPDGGDPDTTYVFTRAEDRSPFLRATYFFEKYKLLFYAIVGWLLASGYEWKTPAKHNAEIRARVDSLERLFIGAQTSRAEMERKLDILIRFRCIEIASDPKIGSLIDLDCDSYLRWRPGYPRPTPATPVAPSIYSFPYQGPLWSTPSFPVSLDSSPPGSPPRPRSTG